MFVTRIRWAISFIKSLFVTLASTLAVLILALSVSSIQPVNAKPLAKKECKTLKNKLKTLKTTPAVMNMSKGFEWVKENMKGDDLLPIKEFIETEEQYKFRCPQPRKKKAPKPKPKKVDAKKNLVDKKNKTKKKATPKKKAQNTKTKKKKNIKSKKNSTKKKPVKKKKKKSSLGTTQKPEPTLFETIFPSSVENKEKS